MAYNTGSAWKSCLGLTSIIIRILKLLFSFLNIHGDIKDFQCKICQFAKSRNTYPNSSQERNSITFSLIHTDVWRYARHFLIMVSRPLMMSILDACL